MKLGIIIPVFNEKNTLEEVLSGLQKVQSPNFEKEIIIVDDFSTDGTRTLLQNLKLQYDFTLILHQKNLGKGCAIRTALNEVTGEYATIQDADLEYDPNDFETMVKNIDSEYPVVFGSRNLNPKRKGYFYCSWGVALLTKIINLLFKSNLTDAYTCYKLLPTKLFRDINIESSGFEVEAEITVKILKRKIKIREIPINYRPRTYKEGKKIKVFDGIIGIWSIFRFWLS